MSMSGVLDQPAYRLWVSEDLTVLVRFWSNGEVEVALRDDPSAIWGPPIRLVEDL